ncbi:MAG: hypothetical protein JWN01_683 [Patescibacteria group bacterium]|nr:hypothetical protein [Patescibacteria group bacterium]
MEVFAAGGGSPTIILDARTGVVHRYNGSEEFHANFGGKTYYRGHARLVGWIPDNPAFVHVGAYRVDMDVRSLPDDFWESVPEIGQHRVAVPFEYYEEGLNGSWPVIAKTEGKFVLISAGEVASLLQGTLALESEEIVFQRFVNTESDSPSPFYAKMKISAGVCRKRLRRTIEALYHEFLRFEWPNEFEDDQPDAAFFRRMGLYPFGEGDGAPVFKIVRGIARERYTRRQVSDTEALQAAAPNVCVVDSRHIVCQDDESSHYIMSADGWSSQVSVPVALRAMAGDIGPAKVLKDLSYHSRSLAPAVVGIYDEGDEELAVALATLSSWGVKAEGLWRFGIQPAEWKSYGHNANIFPIEELIGKMETPGLREAILAAAEERK